jgi:hypothetical protein
MIKMLSINASNQVINHWQDLGYTIIYIFVPDTETNVVRPELSKGKNQVLDPDLTGSW